MNPDKVMEAEEADWSLDEVKILFDFNFRELQHENKVIYLFL
jgi:hypothetical protein